MTCIHSIYARSATCQRVCIQVPLKSCKIHRHSSSWLFFLTSELTSRENVMNANEHYDKQAWVCFDSKANPCVAHIHHSFFRSNSSNGYYPTPCVYLDLRLELYKFLSLVPLPFTTLATTLKREYISVQVYIYTKLGSLDPLISTLNPLLRCEYITIWHWTYS